MYGASTMAIPNAGLSSNTAGARQTNAGSFAGPNGMSLLATFVLFVGLYVLWVLVSTGTKLKDTIQPKNIGVNLYNLAVIVLTVVVAFGLIKLALAKLVAIHFPGATTLATIIKFAV